MSIIRSNRKTISISVRDGELVVHAPLGMKQEAIDQFISRHRRWIEAHCVPPKRLDLSNGAEVVLFGKPYRILEGYPLLGDDFLRLPAERREQSAISLCTLLAREYMSKLTAEIAAKYGLHYTGVRIGSARTRWGTCTSDGRIAYTFRCVFLSAEEAYYLAVHELCHTKHMDHSPAFWREVGKILPNYLAIRKKLKHNTWAMKWL